MAKKSKQLTFADRARAIEKRYSRAKFDKIEKEQMESELQALMQEQEAIREAKGMTNQEQFATGGSIYEDAVDPVLNVEPWMTEGLYPNTPGGAFQGPNGDPGKRFTTQTSVRPAANKMVPRIGSALGAINELQAQKTLDTTTLATKTQPGVTPSWFDKNKQYIPTVASGLSSIAGNLMLNRMSKKQTPQVTAPVANAERMNINPLLQQLDRDATTSKNVNLRNARNLGLNPGAAMANVGAANAAIDRGLGANKTSATLQAGQFNAGSQNRANLANQQAQAQTNQMNAALKAQSLQDRMGFLGSIAETPGMVNREINQIKGDKEMRAIQEAGFKALGRNYFLEGDFWDAPEKGYQFVVRNGVPRKEKK